MEITKIKSVQMHIPELRRSLDTNRSKKLHQGWSKLIQESEIDFVPDAAEVAYVGSPGLCELLFAAKRLQNTSAIVICNRSPFIQQFFTMTGFLKIFPVHNSVEEGVRSLGIST